MASLTVRNLDDEDKRGLRIRAASHGVSMEEEARRIIRHALREAEGEKGVKTADHPEPEKKQWHLKASLDEILALGLISYEPFDQKAAFDALYDYLDEE